MRTQASPALDSSQVALRLGMCAAALAGTAGVVSDASAAVVTVTTSIPVPQNIDGVYINFLTGATGTTPVTGWDFDPYSAGSAIGFFWANAAGAGGVASATTGPYLALTDGAVVSAASTFTASAQTAATPAFQTAGTHILGMRFLNEATATINYGYVTIVNGGSGGFPATITGWSFENTGAAITVSTVPESSTLLMMSMGALALGAANLRKIRRQRREAQNQALPLAA